MAKARAVALVGGDPAPDADPVLLQRVLCNLLHNALRYSPPGAHVQLEAERVGDRVLLRVVDHGSGLDPRYYPDMFTPFAGFPEAGPTGLGLGLSPTWTASSCSAGCGRTPTRPSSCCRDDKPSTTRSTPWTPAPTTT